MNDGRGQRRAAAAAVAASLLIAGCGASGSKAVSTTTRASSPTTVSTSTAPTSSGPTTTQAAQSIDNPAAKSAFSAAVNEFVTERKAQQTKRNAAADKGDVPAAKAAIAAQRTAYFNLDAALRKIDLGADQTKINAILVAIGDVISTLDQFAKIPDSVPAGCTTCQTIAFRYNQKLPVEGVAVNEFRAAVYSLAKLLGVDYSEPQLTARKGYVEPYGTITAKYAGSGSYSFQVPRYFTGPSDNSVTIDLRSPRNVSISSGIAGRHSDPTYDLTDLQAFTKKYAQAVVAKSGDTLVGQVEKVMLGTVEGATYRTTGNGLNTKNVEFRFGQDIVEITLITHNEAERAQFEPLFDEAMRSLKVTP
ncbi:MAG: hypothetical protein JWN46_1079 [Acidimicrobiales bacterium]|nr:hypothetical protein [Acidimicrobiales bacterium]